MDKESLNSLIGDNLPQKIKEVAQDASKMIEIEMHRNNQNHSWGACLNSVLQILKMNAEIAEHAGQISAEAALEIEEKIKEIKQKIDSHIDSIPESEREVLLEDVRSIGTMV